MENSLCRRLTAASFVAAFLALRLSIPASGQVDVSSQLLGTVSDPTGAVVPNVTVSVKSGQTGVEVQTSSNERGDYLFPSLPPGSYTLTCAPTGFKTFVAKDVALQAQKVVTLNIRLDIGASTQSVEINAAANMVDTVTATVQTTYEEKMMRSLPVWGRDPRQTMELLMPGAVGAGTGKSTGTPVTSFNGMSGLSNNYRIDGSDVNDYFHGSSTAYPQSENISEFSVTTSIPDASVGRGAGGQIEAVLKSGGNGLHGQAWGYFQDGDWNANSWENNWQGIERQPFSKRWFGGNVGGQVKIPKIYDGKNKTFFFTSYERTSTSQSGTSTGETISNAERAGDFTNSPDGIPVLDGAPTAVVPLGRFSTMGKFLADNKNVLPAPTSGQTTYSWNPTDQEVVQTLTARIDHNFNDRHRVFGSLWYFNDNPTFDNMFFLFGQGSWASHYPNPSATWLTPNKVQSWTINDTYMISPSMLNNFIFGLKRHNSEINNTYTPATALFDGKKMGVAAVGDVKSPDIEDVSFPRALGLGLWNGYIDTMQETAAYFADNLTWNKGRHTFKMGLEIRQHSESKYQTWGAGANITFSDANVNVGGSGNGIADMMMGLAPKFIQNNTQVLNINYPAREAYFQDTFKVNRRLTVTVGARWEPHFGISPKEDNFVTFHPGQSSTVFPTAPVGLVTIGDQGVPSNLYGVRWGNIGPRASFAWDIFGKGKAALRGGYAQTRNYQVLIGFNGYTNTAPYGVSYTPSIQTMNLSQPYQEYGSVPFPFKPPVKGDPANSSLVFPRPLNTLAMNPDYNSGSVHQFNLTFDIEPVRSYLVSLSWVATRSTHIDETHDFNWPLFVPGASTTDVENVRSRRPYYGYGFESVSMDNSDFNAMYNALQLRVNKRFTHGLTFVGNYTYSSNKTQNGCRYWGDCALDYYSPGTMHNMSVAFAYDLPIPQGRSRVSKALLGGWTLGSTMMGSSGPYSGVDDYNCDEFNYSSASCYANYVGSSPYSSAKGQVANDAGGTPIGLRYLDPSAFVRANQTLVDGKPSTLPGVGQRLFLGNAISGVFKGPASFMVNASLSKDFAFTERFKANYRIEAFNALNHTVLNSPGATVGPDMSHFGVITSAWDPRKLQMSARFIF